MVGLLLFVIVAIAAFNIVSILTMMVNEKRADIAVLRTMGASPRSVMAIFMVQGAVIGLVGRFDRRADRCAAGAQCRRHCRRRSSNCSARRCSIRSVYFISRIPSVVVARDIVKICFVAWLLSLLAAIVSGVARGANTSGRSAALRIIAVALNTQI